MNLSQSILLWIFAKNFTALLCEASMEFRKNYNHLQEFAPGQFFQTFHASCLEKTDQTAPLTDTNWSSVDG